MSDITEVITQARSFLENSQSEQALELLSPFYSYNDKNVRFLQILGETFLENNNVEKAYDVLVKCCELDPEASQGCENFFYLGQIIGGVDGIKYIDIGLRKLESQLTLINAGDGDEIRKDENLIALGEAYNTTEQIVVYLIKKLNQGLFAKIEIWMTDLCMEEEAESQCDSLITHSLSLDDKNPEAWSLLASIRISQQRNEDAIEAIKKSWELFLKTKTDLEQAAAKKAEQSVQQKHTEENEEEEQIDEVEINIEYVELIQPLLTLSRFALELGLFEVSGSIASNIQDINENVVESFYLEGFSYYLQAKKIQWSLNDQGLEDFNDLKLNLNIDENNESFSYIEDSRIALTNGFKLLQVEEDVDPELAEQINVLLAEVGGPNLKNEKIDLNGDDWEDEIESEDETME